LRSLQRGLGVVWDNASWPLSREVRTWMRQHHPRVKRKGGGQRLPCRGPTTSPWRNPLEPRWVHGKHAIVEPDRFLAAAEILARVCADFEAAHGNLFRSGG
jgi:hypothetical protein